MTLDIEKRRKLEGKQREFFMNQLLITAIWYLNKRNIDYQNNNLTDLSNLIFEDTKTTFLKLRK